MSDPCCIHFRPPGAETSRWHRFRQLSAEQILRREIALCAPDTSIRAAAESMLAAGASAIVIADDKGPRGIWTESDAVAVNLGDANAVSLPISEVMSSPLYEIDPHTPLPDVVQLFQRLRVRHLVVVDAQGAPVGVIAQSDVAAQQGVEHYLRLRTVEASMHRDVPEADAGQPLETAVAAMRRARTSAVFVRYEQDYGLLTERDIVRLLAQGASNTAVGEHATRPLISVPKDTSLLRARRVLTEHGVRHLGITEDGAPVGLLGINELLCGLEHAYLDELEEVLYERNRALRSSQDHLNLAERIIQCSLEGIMITDPRGVIERVNPAFTHLTGYSAEEVIGKTPAVLSSGRQGKDFYRTMWKQLHEQGQWSGEIWNRRKNGELYPELLTITAIHDGEGNLSHYAGIFNDISKIKEQEAEIRALAYHDALTGLPNRRLLDDRMNIALAQAYRHRHSLGLIFIDLDRFKDVNDGYGHNVGDELLVQVADRLRQCVREGDTVARLGGDEFIILLAELEQDKDAPEAAARIASVLEPPFVIGPHALSVGASLGISIYPRDGETVEVLLRRADRQMYLEKSSRQSR